MDQLTQDLVSMLRALPGSVQVDFEGQKTWGLLKVDGESFGDGGGRLQVLGQSQVLIIADGSLVGLWKGSELLVGQKAYRIEKPVPRTDGSLELTLEGA